MEMESCVPPGFRFHPTEEELVGYYLKRKIDSQKIDLDVIANIDLYKMEPWDIQARCNLGYAEQNEWYFFSHKDRKYPTGTRTNRATAAGFWKATGRDKAVLSKNRLIGMRKTLVFYKGRAPNGRKTDWIMHEYRLQTSEHGPPQEEGWVVCRAFKKPSPNQRQGFEAWSHAYYLNDINHARPPSFSDTVTTAHNMVRPNQGASFQQPFGSNSDLVSNQTFLDNNNQLVELPELDSPSTLSTSFAAKEGNFHQTNEDYDEERSNNSSQYIDWKNFDTLLASQVTDSSTSYPLQDLPSIPQNYDLAAGQQDQYVSHFLDCFPDL
ncbi:hypothetical protein POPTR_019G083600v4 [Populus trichocarpa]|uniref:Transcription factor n=2 Tax=Populus trichocarpa TaxID=3694 RepID=E5KUI2_POPTR|nr:NAC domain-containing protein 30 [Populus trichocarpa]ADR00341.1 wood-associated NAC domain transcription factor 6B [Populus trichocarpa]KAI5555427.1 hypothetical protein BDE02_19G079800 [Populus trichocarpa]KAI5555428.1 hypothetical protein BDE02_19G079800 [Populus trichocarpa]KAI9377616.1 hypothetical protein POPTR_019G083600v4 [Populus trichocarpa]PNS91144.1 hypothetical protein POPTR_019G083600v4 [Populus trichocarpa]|eukprot:XP_024447115.1 NAC domain-containing protein 30 [Populus trichocarpa]